MQISDLSPGTAYMFRVQALSPEGKPGSYSMEHEFKTLPMGKCPRNWRLLFFSNVQIRFLCHSSVLWSNCVLWGFSAESQIQSNSTVVMGAVVGGGIMLLVVVVVLLLHKRLEHTTAIISLCPKIVYDYGWLTGQS